MADLRRDDLAAPAAMRAFPAPTVAVNRGRRVGGGVEPAACCDLRFADETAIFGVTPAKVGIVHPPASNRGLLDLVGPATTKYLLHGGELLDAPAALRTGLVDQLVEADELEAAVGPFTDVLVPRSALSQRATEEVIASLTQGDDGEVVVAPRYRETIASGSWRRASWPSRSAGSRGFPGEIDHSRLIRPLARVPDPLRGTVLSGATAGSRSARRCTPLACRSRPETHGCAGWTTSALPPAPTAPSHRRRGRPGR